MSLPTVLRTKRCCRDNERSGNEIITFPLVVSLKASAILIFIASVQCKQRNLTARHLTAFPLRGQFKKSSEGLFTFPRNG